MNNTVTIEQAKEIMGRFFVGPKELDSIKDYMPIIDNGVPPIPFDADTLHRIKEDYVLILGASELSDGKPVTIRNMRAIFGVDPDMKEPCFYNQDWYDNETFVDLQMKNEWYVIRKSIYDKSRAVDPEVLNKQYGFPSAIVCTFSFFVVWLCCGEKLWYHDYIWCKDLDHNGDQIYVGKYNDVDSVNKNGFSIHRHLSLRRCYGCIDLM